MSVSGDLAGEILPLLVAKDGTALFHKVWHPSNVRAGQPVVVLVHGLGEHCDRYDNLVGPLLSDGYTVVGYDHRGHGRSEGARAVVRAYDEFLDDLRMVLDDVEQRYPDSPVYLVGHSMGGNIALGFALEEAHRLTGPGLDGIVLSGPALGNNETPKGLAAKALHLIGPRAPGLGLPSLDATAICRDPAVVAAYRADPLVHTGKIPIGLASALIKAMESFPARLGGLTLPVLLVHGTADQLCDVERTRELEAGLVNADVTAHYYDGLYHEVFNEPEHPEVVADVLAWLNSQD